METEQKAESIMFPDYQATGIYSMVEFHVLYVEFFDAVSTVLLFGNLDGRVVWRRMDTCICMAESLCCSPETATTLFVNWLYPNTK